MKLLKLITFFPLLLLSTAASQSLAQSKSPPALEHHLQQKQLQIPADTKSTFIVINPAEQAQQRDANIDNYARNRLTKLEEAVRQLQEEVYWLRANQQGLIEQLNIHATRQYAMPPKQVEWACLTEGAFGDVYVGKGTTKVEAVANAKRECLEHSMRCSEPKCEQGTK